MRTSHPAARWIFTSVSFVLALTITFPLHPQTRPSIAPGEALRPNATSQLARALSMAGHRLVSPLDAESEPQLDATSFADPSDRLPRAPESVQSASPTDRTIKDYGARGDGITDDTAAIQAAINSLPLNIQNAGIISPKGFANGGLIRIPRGRYKITQTIMMRRGLRLVGESRESSQIISYTPNTVFKYEDNDPYIQDEIVIENLSIWQDGSVGARSGAGIECSFGTASIQSIGVICRNVYIEGTYKGIILSAGVWSSFDNVYVNKCISHGFDVRFTADKIGKATSTTSTTFKNCYASMCDSGFRIEMGAYCSFVSCASDSNTNYGYIIEKGLGHSLLACGAEENGAGGIYVNGATGTLINAFITYSATAGTKHGIVLKEAASTTIIGGTISTMGAPGGYGIHVVKVGGRVTVIGTEFLGNFTKNEIDNNFKTLVLAENGGLIGVKGHWSIGALAQPEEDSKWAITGKGDPTMTNAQKVKMTHSVASAIRNTEIWAQFVSDNEAVSYPLCIGLFVANALKGASATHQRVAGSYIIEQTSGAVANANTLIDAGVGTIPAGNWDHYSDSARESFWKAGQFRFLTTTGPVVKFGKGSPEGVVAAPIGSTYHRTDGGAGTSFYVKESGAGNTGWVGK